MRKVLFGILGLAALGMGVSQPAEAQGYYPGRYGPAPVIDGGYGAYAPVAHHPRHGYRNDDRRHRYRNDDRRRGYGHDYRRRGPVYPAPAYGWRGPRYGYYRPAYAQPRCFVRMQQAWNGWRWINQPVRVCR